MEGLQKNGNVEEPSFPVPQQKTTIHKQKQLWETFRVCFGSFSNIMGKNRNNQQKRRKTTSFSLQHPITQARTVGSQEGTSWVERVCLARKGKARWASIFSSLLGHCMKISLWFHPTRPTKLRCVELGKRKKSRSC